MASFWLPRREVPRRRGPPERPRSQLIVALNSKPEYTPRNGPPLQPISLAPPDDTTGYILERILLPSAGHAKNGKPLPKRMTYIVGWKDLPAATALVPAMDILDYVSPRSLEDWEAQHEEEIEQERNKLQETQLGQSEQAAGNRKKAKPRQSQIEASTAIETNVDSPQRNRVKAGAMSLSTPRKRKLDDFESLSDTDESPSRQIQRELLSGSEVQPQTGDAIPSKQDAEDVAEDAGMTNYSSATDGECSSAYDSWPRVPNLENGKTVEAESDMKVVDSAVEAEGDRWEIKRIIGEGVFEDEGGVVKTYYRVLWEGDWPVSENPTWEPEDQLPRAAIVGYKKRSFKRRRKDEALVERRQMQDEIRAIQASGDSVTHNMATEAVRDKIPDSEEDELVMDQSSLISHSGTFLLPEEDEGEKEPHWTWTGEQLKGQTTQQNFGIV